jgi:hypothetical protein
MARFAYRVPLATVVESSGGLTDAHTAHQRLETRGRPGHEKHPSLDYLIFGRNAVLSFALTPEAYRVNDYIPLVLVKMGGYTARLLHWDPALVNELRRRGAIVADYPTMLDELLAQLGGLPDEVVRREAGRARRFYFAHVDDPVRAAAFSARLDDRAAPVTRERGP